MKFPNYLKNVFAGLGVLSLIFYTCASESTSDDSSSNLPPQITEGYGKYQVAMGSASNMVILNTETGVLKSYARNPTANAPEWVEGSFVYNDGSVNGSGNLTVNH